jgi:putative ABC transport system permease protein
VFKNYFKSALRSLIKRKYYSSLNILGLSLSILCCIFLYLFIRFHLGFDRYHKNAALTYRLVNEIYFEKTAYIRGASMGMYRELLSVNPDIMGAGVMVKDYTFTIGVKNQNAAENLFKEDKDVALVSPNWFGMFNYIFIAGSAEELAYPNTAVITKRQASKYFGNLNPVGRTMLFPNNTPIKIVGLISDEPYNSDLRSEIFISLPSFKNLFPNKEERYFTDWAWIDTHISLFLTLNNSKSRIRVEAEINKLAEAHLGDNAKYYHFFLQPLKDIHFESNYGGAIQKPLLVTLMIIGICILAIGSFNYINFSITQQAGRMLELGARKLLGATAWNLFIQLITETFLTVSVAIVIAAFIFTLSFPAVNHSLFAQSPLYAPTLISSIQFLIILALSLTIMSGIYPAMVLSGGSVIKDLKKITGSRKTGILRQSLLIAQNSISCILIICTIVMVMQVQFLKHTQIGFNSSAVIMIPLPDTSGVKINLISNRLGTIPGITSYSFCHFSPSSENDWGGSVKFGDRAEWEKWQGKTEVGDAAYVKTFNLEMIAGRNLRRAGKSPEFLINQSMLGKSGFKNPDEALGKQLIVGEFGDEKGTIVGVVKDFNSQSLLVPIEPVVITDQKEKYSSIAIRLTGQDMQTVIGNIQREWKEAFVNDVFEYHFADDQIAVLYLKQDLQHKLIWIAATIAVIISSLGLIGLVSLITVQRTKEIGIRKVLGASVAGIVQLISKDFLKLLLIAIAVSIPLAWSIMNDWIQGFAYHVNISWWVFALASSFSLMIALIAVCLQVIKAATANPVNSLRTEG